MINRNGKSVSAVWYQGKQVKQVWFRGGLYYSSSTPYSGFEAALDQIDSRSDVFRLLPRDGTEVLNVSSTTVNSHAHMLVEGDSSLVFTQAGREALGIRVSGGTVSVVSNGDRGKGNLAFSAPWPGGKHLVSASTASDWYGYRLKLFIDGVQVETATNGGAFNLSENPFVSGDLTVSSEGCLFWSVHVGKSAVTNAVTRISWVADFVTPGTVSWRVHNRDTEFRVPGGLVQAWAYSGGDGGAGGDGGDGYNGADGASGKGSLVPDFSLSMLPSLVPGAGGGGGKGGAGGRGYSSGKPGQPGSPTTLTGFTTATATTRPTPSAWGSTFNGVLPGEGGAGGRRGGTDSSGDYYSGSDGSPGQPGGIVIARKW